MSERLTGDYRKFMDKNYLGSWDVPDGEDLVLTIDHVEQNDVKNERGTEKKLTVHFVENYKPMILNKTNAESISKVGGIELKDTGRGYKVPRGILRNVEDWKGLRIAIYTKEVTAFGGTTDALRIREYPPRETEAFCEECGHEIKRHGDYSVNKIVTMTEAKYGRKLCWECAKKAKEASDEK